MKTASLILVTFVCALPLAAKAQTPSAGKLEACTSSQGLKAQGECLQGVVDEAETRLKGAIAILQDRTSIELRGEFSAAQKSWETYREQTCGRMAWDIEKAGVGAVQRSAACVLRLTEQRIEIVNGLLSEPN